MAAAASRLGSAIDGAGFAAGCPQAFNIDGQVRTHPAEVAAALRSQLTSPVRWVDCVQTLVGLGAERFLELGPGSTLAALGRRIAATLEWSSASTSAAVRAVAPAA